DEPEPPRLPREAICNHHRGLHGPAFGEVVAEAVGRRRIRKPTDVELGRHQRLHESQHARRYASATRFAPRRRGMLATGRLDPRFESGEGGQYENIIHWRRAGPWSPDTPSTLILTLLPVIAAAR